MKITKLQKFSASLFRNEEGKGILSKMFTVGVCVGNMQGFYDNQDPLEPKHEPRKSGNRPGDIL